jgi:sodium transport system permease protein
MGILILAPMLVGVLSTIFPIENQPWMFAVPMLGQYVLLTNVLGGRPPNPVIFIGAAVSCVIAAMFVIRVTVALFRDERIIFGR